MNKHSLSVWICIAFAASACVVLLLRIPAVSPFSGQTTSAPPTGASAPSGAGGTIPRPATPHAKDLPPGPLPARENRESAHAAATDAASPRKRAWDSRYLAALGHPRENAPIRFELVAGIFASGTVQQVETRSGEVIRISGHLTAPETGRFFFQKQPLPGKAGDFVGLVEFPASLKAYRIEPTGPGGASELVERRLDEVICLMMPCVDDGMRNALDIGEIPPLEPQDVPDIVPPYNSGIISLQSLPGAAGVLYIDYRGGYTPTWGGIAYEKPSASNAQIKDVWKRVAEDYMPFNVNVTTDIRVYESAPENSRQRVIVTPTKTAAPTAGGVAYMNSWNWTGDTPCWAFYATGKSAAEVISHEAGHTLTLGHDGRIDPYNEGYFGGHGSGATGWAPIMGVGYYKPVAQWSKGEYAYANNAEDDLAKITANNNRVDYRPDDTGSALAGARHLDIATDFSAFAEGVIETTGDTDALRFTTAGGAVTLTALPVGGDWADLAIQATLADSADTVIASNSPQGSLSAAISTNLAAGTYTFRVTGAGRNSALTNGFSDYASLGYYTVTGRVSGARLATYLTVSEGSASGTFVGAVPPAVPNGDPLIYMIETGNVANAFSLDNTGALRVANAAALNYETFASNTQFTVRMELFVTISNTVTPALTETGRRVVVQILDVNEQPAVTGFNATILAHTLPGTAVGTVTGSDADAYSFLTYSILSGNSGNAFAVSSSLGTLTVAADIDAATQTVYTLTVRAVDNGTPAQTNTATARVTVVPNASGLRPGSISYAAYDAIGSGTYVSNLTQHARFPYDPDWEGQYALFEGPTGRADAYGAVMRGYLIPPASGTYTFWIATDDNGELWMSTTTNPAAMTRIAYLDGYASSRQWTKYSTQKSAARALIAGQAYYVEARMKEGGGGDHVAVAWVGPATANQTNVISGLYLAPYFMNYVPHPSGFTNAIRRNLQTGAKVGRISVADVNPDDTAAFAITAGNTGETFSVDGDGWVRIRDDAALLTAASPVTLTLRATDSGTPARSGTATAQITLLATNALSSATPRRELFYNIGGGSAVGDLTGNAKYPGRPDALASLTNFATPVNIAESYGSRIRALITVPTNGDYRFFIASDDASQLKFSRTGNPGLAQTIASVNGWVNANVFTQYTAQVSALQTNLVAGQTCYLEALHKEGGGGDHVSVAWAGPGLTGTNIIDGTYLTPLDINSDPALTNQTLRVSCTNLTGHWIGRVAVTDSPLDTLSFKITAGNAGSTFAIDPDTGDLFLASTALTSSQAQNLFALTVNVQDSGYGGLYPLHAKAASVTVLVLGPPAMSTFSRQGEGLRLVWGSLPGLRYQLQSATNLIAPTWVNVGSPVTGAGTPLTNDFSVGAEPSKFFRLLLLE